MIKRVFSVIAMLAAGTVAAAQTPTPGWTERAVDSPTPSRPRILLMHDMEGLAGWSTRIEISPSPARSARSREQAKLAVRQLARAIVVVPSAVSRTRIPRLSVT